MMPLEKQVCSLELSKKLKGLGVKQESLFAWERTREQEEYSWGLSNKKDIYHNNQDEVYASAFTVPELGEMLPSGIELDNPSALEHLYNDAIIPKQWYLLSCGRSPSETGWWVLYSSEDYKIKKQFVDKTEANVRAKMLVYLLENGLIGKERG